MKRFPLLLSLALAMSAIAVPPPAGAVPDPGSGGPAELLRYVGDPKSGTGNALANGQCDVNGDGHDDAVVGAWFWDKAPVNSLGAAYVLLGGESVAGGSLADPDDVGAVRIDGPAVAPPVAPATTVNGTAAAFAVACVGDVNGDGFDDIAISDYDLQRAYIVFGEKDFKALSLDSLGDRGYIAQAPPATAGNFSFSLAPVGDVNADGKDDFAVAEVGADNNGRINSGRVWVLGGRDDISDVDVASPAPGQVLLTVDGALASERLGQVAKAGDVNGDGIDDFVLGSYTSTPWGSAVAVPGAAYVVFGGSTGSIDLASLGTRGFTIRGPQRQRDRLGISVSAAGDIDGDGLADLLIGADGVNSTQTGARNGGAAVVLGSASTSTVYTDPVAANGQAVFTCPSAETPPACGTPTRRGYWINGVANSDSTGYSVAGIGDVDADGVPDFALGAYGFDPVDPQDTAAKLSGAGAVYVVLGRTTGAVQELAELSDAAGYRLDGLRAGDRFGRQVGLIGDFDGNEARDVVASGDFANRTDAGPEDDAQNGELVVALMGRLTTDVAVAGPARVLPGEAATFTAAVTKRAGDRAPLGQGTVSFTRAGTAIDGCEAVPVTAGRASCTAVFAEGSTGQVVAVYVPPARLAPATSAPIGLTVANTAGAVAKAASRTTFTRSRDTLRGKQRLTIGIKVTARGATPTGRVQVKIGSKVVKTVTLRNGRARYTLPRFATGGTRKISVTYPGSADVAGSRSRTKSVRQR